MATQERLMKSLDILKSLINPNLTTDLTARLHLHRTQEMNRNINIFDIYFRKKDKILHCNIISDAMCNSSVRVASNFQNLLCFSIEILLQLCDDQESDVRMVADESLNRIIRVRKLIYFISLNVMVELVSPACPFLPVVCTRFII